MVLGLGSKGGCNDPCSECGGPCDVCDDMSGARSVLMTLPDIATQTDLDVGGPCPECEDYSTPTELVAIDQGTSATILDGFASSGCTTAETPVADSVCGYAVEESCGSKYTLARFAATYRTAGGDLRMFVGLIITYNDTGCTGVVTESDDFLLATGSYRFNCLDLDHDGSFAVCSGSDPACGCTVPVNYNVQIIAA